MSKFIEEGLHLRIVRNIFLKLDDIIFNCKTKNPVPFNESKFKKEYERIKKDYL